MKYFSLGMPCRPRSRLQARALCEARARPQGRSHVSTRTEGDAASARSGLQRPSACGPRPNHRRCRPCRSNPPLRPTPRGGQRGRAGGQRRLLDRHGRRRGDCRQSQYHRQHRRGGRAARGEVRAGQAGCPHGRRHHLAGGSARPAPRARVALRGLDAKRGRRHLPRLHHACSFTVRLHGEAW